LIRRPRVRRLRTKIIFSFCLLMVAGGALTTSLVRQTVLTRVESGAERAARGLADTLATQLAEPLAFGDRLTARRTLTRAVDASPDVVYALVVAPRGDLLSHSFPADRVPAELLTAVVGHSHRGVLHITTEAGPALDAAAPIGEGLLGTLHLGVSTAWVRHAAIEAVGNVIVITLAAVGVGILGIIALSNLITRPLSQLRGAAERVGRGEAPLGIALSGHDEVAALSRSFDAMARQIRARVAEVEALRAYFERVLDHLPLAITVIDREGRVEYANRYVGHRRDAAPGVSYAELFGDDRPPLDPDEAPSGRSHTTPDGRVFALERVPLTDGEGTRRVLEVGHDVTHERALAAQVQRAERLAVAGEIAAGVVHTINNPLDGVKRALDLAAARPEDAARVVTMLDLAIEGVDRIASVTRTLLTFARPGRDGAPTPSDVNGVAEAAAKLVRLTADSAGVTLELDLDPDLDTIVIDPGGVSELLVNLLINAVDACREARDRPGRVALRTARADRGGVEITVEDDGVGIAPDDLQRIFEPFFTTKDVGRGTGLGLPVARRVVDAHGGTLTVASELGSRTAFTIWLPGDAGGGAAP